MQRTTDDDERPEPAFDIERLRAEFQLPDAPWQLIRDRLLDEGGLLTIMADEMTYYYSLPAPNSWITCDVLGTGARIVAGTIGEANQRSLKEALPSEEWVEKRDDYSKQLWLLDNDANRRIIEDLERNHPLYDDEEHSKVETEWELAAWDDYGWWDLKRECRRYERHTEAWEERVDDLTDGERFNLYREAMELANAYPTFEYNDACLPLDDIVSEFFDVTERKFQVQDGGFTHHPDQKMLPF